jgi:hypothetical protein
MLPSSFRRRAFVAAAVAIASIAALDCNAPPRRIARTPRAGTASASASASGSASILASASASASSHASASASTSVSAVASLPPLPEPEKPAPVFARVSLLSAVFGPGRSGGAQWGKLGIVPADVWSEVSKALKADDPYSAITTYIAGGGYAGLDSPDVKGKVTLRSPDGDKTFDVPRVIASFTPSWSGLELRHVPLDRRTRLRIDLVEATSEDKLGGAELDASALSKIDEAGKVVAWPLADQTANQVLFVMISVVKE